MSVGGLGPGSIGAVRPSGIGESPIAVVEDLGQTVKRTGIPGAAVCRDGPPADVGRQAALAGALELGDRIEDPPVEHGELIRQLRAGFHVVNRIGPRGGRRR
jgi:hypothetical protein